MSSKQSKLRDDMTRRMAARTNEGASKSRLSGTLKKIISIARIKTMTSVPS